MSTLKYILIFTLLLILPSVSEAANRYWVGAAGGCDGTWADTDCWAATSNGAGAAGVPTSADDVFFDGVGNGASNSTLGAAITINSLDFTGYANTFTHGAFTITIDNAGAFKLGAGMTYTLGNTNLSIIQFTNTTGTVLITSNGKTGPRLVLSGTGTWQLQDNYTCGGTRVDQTAGTLDINGFTLTTTAFNSTGSTARTLTLGSGTIAATGNGSVFDISGSNVTITANTGSFTHTSGGGGGQIYTFGDFNYNGASFNSTVTNTSFTMTLAGTGWNNFSVVPVASGAVTISLTAPFTVTGTLTLTGNNSNTKRIFVTSNTLGTSRTITSAANALSSVDFRDITGAGAASWNLSAITGLSGDAGGNSGITFTSAQTQYWVGGTGSWSTAAEWGTSSGGSGGRVPLPQDDVVFDNGSFNNTGQIATLDMPRAGKSLDFSAYNEGQTPTFQYTVSTTIYGSLTLNSSMTFTAGTTMTFEGRGSFTLTNAGKSFGSATISIGMVGGTLSLQDAYTSSNSVILTNGTFNANNFNVTSGGISSNLTTTRGLTMGSGTFTVVGTGTQWNFTTVTGLTFSANTSTIIMSNTTATSKVFAGGGLTYNNVVFSGNNITVQGSNTFNQFKVNTSGQPTGLILTSGTTQTVSDFSTDASLGRRAWIWSSAGGPDSEATISKASGLVCVEYMHIEGIVATGGASFYAGNSVNEGGGTVGWSFTQCPSPNQTSRGDASSGGPANVKIGSSPAVGGAPGWYSTLWGYRRPIVVDRTRVATTSSLTNFPLLVSVIDPDLRSTGNGGKVASTTAGDIVFTSSDGTTLLDFEIEKYVSTTGELVAWVEVPSLSGVTNTTLYMYLGNASATNLQNPSGVWDSNYKGVWHLKNGTTLNVADSTSNANNGTNNNGATATTGKIDGGLNENNSGEYISTSLTTNNTNITVSGWMYTVAQNNAAIAVKIWDGSTTGYELGIAGASGSNVTLRWAGFQSGFRGVQTSTATVSLNNWHYIVGTYDGTQWHLYINGSLSESVTAAGPPTGNTGGVYIANTPWNGKVDEVRVSFTNRGTDWIATEYNNQVNPASFYSYQGLENMNGRVNSGGISVPFLKIRGGVKFR